MGIEEYKGTFYNNVQQLRRSSKLSLADVAKRSGVPLEMLEQLEQNILPEEMTVDDAFALAKTFHCKIHELFE